MSIQGLSYALGRCVSAVDFCWGVRKPHICGFSKVYLSWEFSASPKGNAQLAWPRLASYCDGDQIKFVPNTLISRALTLKCSEGLRSEQRNSSGWDVKWSMHKKGRASGTQYTLTSHFLSGIDFPREEDSKTALQTMDRKSEEDGFGDQSTEVAMLRDLEAALGSPFESGPQAPAPKPLIIVISGPSGVGKDAVIKRLQEVRKGIHFVVTATTRAKRPGEVDGKDYYFIHKEEFSSMIEKNELLEYALVYGDYKGIPKQQVRDFMSKGFDIILRVDVQGAATLRSILGNSALFVFLVAESEIALVRRLMERKTETMEKLLVRISTAREEVKRMSEFDYVVVNAEGNLEESVKLLNSIIDAEKARVQQRTVKI
eukprot:Gb_13993 [translate_table: standard]